jgi:ribosomal protein S18 acetylase RimI-like enzyme
MAHLLSPIDPGARPFILSPPVVVPGMAPTIEPAGTRDIETVTDMWVRLAEGQREYGSHILPVENRTAIRETVSRHVVSDATLVAREGTVVGFVMFTLERGTFEQGCLRGIVENLYVVPDRRSEGIGTALLDAAESTLLDRGAEVVSLEVMAQNEQSREFYRQQGYDVHRVELEKHVESDTHSKGDP